MKTKELLELWKDNSAGLRDAVKEARESLKKRGMIHTRLLGWVNQKELDRLLDTGAIMPISDKYSENDYAYTTFMIDGYVDKTVNGKVKKEYTGKKISILTPEAVKLVCPDRREVAKRAVVEQAVDVWKEEIEF